MLGLLTVLLPGCYPRIGDDGSEGPGPFDDTPDLIALVEEETFPIVWNGIINGLGTSESFDYTYLALSVGFTWLN
jgi:hypothetical protein